MTNFNCIYSYIVYFLNLFRSKAKFSNERIVYYIFSIVTLFDFLLVLIKTFLILYLRIKILFQIHLLFDTFFS